MEKEEPPNDQKPDTDVENDPQEESDEYDVRQIQGRQARMFSNYRTVSNVTTTSRIVTEVPIEHLVSMGVEIQLR